jgi:ferrochelatase
MATLPPGEAAGTRLVFTAHSIPVSMAASAGAATMAALTGTPTGGRYEDQLREVAGLVAAQVGRATRMETGGRAQVDAVDPAWDLVYQSRSGPPQVPWLGPDINEHLTALARAGATRVVVSPIGFVSDHMEVVWDLDTEAADTARSLGLSLARAATPGTDPRFVGMIRELILERTDPGHPRAALGRVPTWDHCDAACCPGGRPAPVTND